MKESSEMSGSGITQGKATPNHQAPDLTGYFPYLSIMFKFTATLIILVMAGWVVFTIKTSRKLHKPHNIFVAHLMITDNLSSLLNTFPTSAMIIRHVSGVGEFVTCRMYTFTVLVPLLVLRSMYLMITLDQVIAIAYPYKYRKIMKHHHVIIDSIAAAWLVPAALQLHTFSNPGYVRIAQYGICISEKGSLLILRLLTTTTLPIFTCSLKLIRFKGRYERNQSYQERQVMR